MHLCALDPGGRAHGFMALIRSTHGRYRGGLARTREKT